MNDLANAGLYFPLINESCSQGLCMRNAVIRKQSKYSHFASTIHYGEMAEWSKARDSKSRNPHKGFEGSNPSLSASLRVYTFFQGTCSSFL